MSNALLAALVFGTAVLAGTTSIDAATTNNSNATATSAKMQVATKTFCGTAHQDAVVASVPEFERPPIAEAEDVSGTSVVKVSLTPSGGLASASLWNSSGNTSLDAAALRVARLSKYRPEIRDCEGVPSADLIEVQF